MEKIVIDGTEIEVVQYNKVFGKAYIKEVSKPMPKPLEMLIPILYIKRLKKYYENYEAKVFVYPRIKITISSCNLIELCKLLYQKNEYIIENQKYYVSTEQLMNLHDYLKSQKSEHFELEFIGTDGIVEKEKLPKSVQEEKIKELAKSFGVQMIE